MSEENVLRLRRKIHKTKGARFEANRRLIKKYRISVWAISILSFYVICISVGLLIFSGDYSDFSGKILTFLSVAMSVFIIILSLLNESDSHQLNAELMHNCARELSELYNNLPISNQMEEDELKQYFQKYQDILSRFHRNHDDLDKKIYEANDPFEGQGQGKFPYIRYFVNVYLFPIFCMIFPLVVFFAILLYEACRLNLI
ncbi:SLATT domain-containing protein [Roseibium aggregatum]|uniref:SLATT domain-containing protein n=1 Tax=Roseibium aggregatum TaxID=187304 RepID=UPI003A973B8E